MAVDKSRLSGMHADTHRSQYLAGSVVEAALAVEGVRSARASHSTGPETLTVIYTGPAAGALVLAGCDKRLPRRYGYTYSIVRRTYAAPDYCTFTDEVVA